MLAALGASAGSLGAQTFTVGPNDGAVALASTAQVPTPAPQVVTITNTGATALGAATLGAATYSAGASNWLTVAKLHNASTLSAGATVNLLRVSVTPGSLAAGTYTATVPVTVSGAASSTSVVVTLAVAGPTFGPSSGTVASWSATTTNAAPTTRLYVRNVGSTKLEGIVRGTIEYPAGMPAWVSAANLASSGIVAGDSTFLTVSPRDTLPAGTYTARIPVTSTNATNSPFYTDVTFTTAGPSLAIDGATNGAAAVTLTTGPGALHPSTTLTVRNVGTSATRNLRVGTITYGPGRTNWLSASIGNQDFGVNITRSLTVLASSAGTFAPGTYTASFSILASNVDPAQAPTVTVTLVVGPPQLTLSPEALTYVSDAATPSPSHKFVTIENPGGSQLRWGVTRTEYAEAQTGWVSTEIYSNSAAIYPGAQGSLAVLVAPAGLPQGTYHATLTVSALNDATVPSKTFTVTLTRSGTAISVPQTVAIASPQGGGSTIRDVQIVNGGAGTLSGLSLGTIAYAAGQPTDWITGVTLSSTSAPSTLRITANTAGLAAGTYTAVVPVLAPGASNSPQNVTVNFTVAPARVFFGGIGDRTVSATVGGADPAAQIVNVSNAGGAALTGLATTVEYTSGAASSWLDVALDRTDAPAVMTLRPRTGALTPGLYVAKVTVTGTDAQPLAINVRFTVLDAPTIGFLLQNGNSTSPTWSATATQGAAAPAPVTFVARNIAGGTLDNLTVSSITYDAGQPTGWLAATLSGSTAPSNLTITANHAALPPGTYVGKVWVNSPAASNGPQAITYTLTVKAAPVLALSRTSVPATAMTGSTPSHESVTISSATSGAMSGIAVSAVTYAAGEPTGWLSASAPSGSISAGSSTSTTLTFASAALAPGVYHAAFAVSAADAINGPQTVNVTLTVTSRPSIVLAPAHVAMAAQANGNTTAPHTVDVTNGGQNPLTQLSLGATQYAAGASGWLTASITTTSAPATVTLRASPAGLAAGTYTAQVPVVSSSSSVANSPQAITVTFTVSAQPILAFSETNPALAAQAGSAAVTRVLTVQNAGGGTLDGLAVQAIHYGSATTGWLQATLDRATAPATLTLVATPGALPAGSYTANVVVASPAASNGAQILPV
ncbi:MAG: beta strand repeat-containing protein, partial [Gemmatirosa sp.]